MRPASRYVVIFILFLLGAAWAPTALSGPESVGDESPVVARRVVELTNQERVKMGLQPLRWNDTLAAAGVVHAQDMATRNYFAHNSPEGSTPVERARKAGYPAYGWGGLYVGENLARGYANAEGAMGGWLASPGHKDNLLNPKYREIGVGVVTAPNGTRVIAQEFGCEPRDLPVFINADAPSTSSRNVTLAITAEDVSSWGSVGPVASIQVSNRPDFADAVWQPHVRTLSWTLSGTPGVQRVYVRYKDVSGVVVESSDDIVYDGPAVPTPTPTPIVPKPAPTAVPTAYPMPVMVETAPTSSSTESALAESTESGGAQDVVAEETGSEPSSSQSELLVTDWPDMPAQSGEEPAAPTTSEEEGGSPAE